MDKNELIKNICNVDRKVARPDCLRHVSLAELEKYWSRLLNRDKMTDSDHENTSPISLHI